MEAIENKTPDLTSQELIYKEQMIQCLVYDQLTPIQFMEKFNWKTGQYFKYLDIFYNAIIAEFRVVKLDLRMNAFKELAKKVEAGNMQAINTALRETAHIDGGTLVPGDPAASITNQQINLYFPEKGKKETIPIIAEAKTIEPQELSL